MMFAGMSLPVIRKAHRNPYIFFPYLGIFSMMPRSTEGLQSILRREINKDRKPLPLSFAYGICTSDDKELDPAAHEDRTKLIDEVLKLSDKRMYECKVAIKAGTLEI